jgi:parallel beta-helix repeat protein
VVRGFILDAVNTQYDAVKVTSISSAGAAHHIRIQDCEIKNAPQMGILTTLGAHSNEFVGVSVHDNGQTDFHHGVYLSTDGNLVADADIYRNAGWGVHVYNQTSGQSANFNVIRNSRLFDNARVGARGDGIVLSSGQGHQAYNTLVWNNKQGIVTRAGARGALVANNVVYANRGAGILLESSSSDSQVRNNIAWQNTGGNLANSGVATAQSNNLVGVDPRFVNAGARDFRLQAGSPAIDTGTPVSAVTVDFDGVPRPQHAAYDIGAFEWQ